jgi:hypothetical protein
VSYVELARLGQVQLRLSYDRIKVLVEVWDASEAVPVLKESDFMSEGGRGLHLVAAYCRKWGWYPSFEPDPRRPGQQRQRGKVVWGRF